MGLNEDLVSRRTLCAVRFCEAGQQDSPIVFRIEFDSVSLSDYVRPDDARDELQKAERYAEKDQFHESCAHAAVAFEVMLGDYENRKRGSWGSPFFVGRQMWHHSGSRMGLQTAHSHSARAMDSFVKETVETIQALQKALRIMALGIDYRRFARFNAVTPPLIRVSQNEFRLPPTALEYNPSRGDAQFCVDFVIEAAVSFHELDFDAPTRRTGTTTGILTSKMLAKPPDGSE